VGAGRARSADDVTSSPSFVHVDFYIIEQQQQQQHYGILLNFRTRNLVYRTVLSCHIPYVRMLNSILRVL
jgi:hypothetical protein